MKETSVLSVTLYFLSSQCYKRSPTSRGYSVHYRTKIPFPLFRQARLAEGLEVGLHGGVHREEVALKEATECSGGHFSYLENSKGKR